MTRQGEALKTRTTNQRPRHARTAAASVGAAALLTVLGANVSGASTGPATPTSAGASSRTVTIVSNDMPRSVKRGRSVMIRVNWANTHNAIKKVQFSTKFDCYAASGVIRSTPQAWTTYAIPPGGRITSTKVWVSSKCLPAVAGWETSPGHNAVFETHRKVGSYKGAFVEPQRVVY